MSGLSYGCSMAGLVPRREGEEAEHEDERHDRVEDLDRHVVAQLRRKAGLALAAAVDDDRPDLRPQTITPTTSRTIQLVTQRPMMRSVWLVTGGCPASEAGQESVQLRLRAPCQDECKCRCDRNSGPSETTIVTHR